MCGKFGLTLAYIPKWPQGCAEVANPFNSLQILVTTNKI